MTNHRLFPSFLPVFLLLLLALSACSDVSPAFGQYFRGRILDVSIVTLEKVPELRYASADGQAHFLVRPSSEDMELVLMRIKVENHTATSAIVSIDNAAAQLRGVEKGSTQRMTYLPLDIRERSEQVGAPENPGVERQIVFLWNVVDEEGTPVAFELLKDFGLDGWMVFEAPKDIQFTELRWRAGDSLTIEF